MHYNLGVAMLVTDLLADLFSGPNSIFTLIFSAHTQDSICRPHKIEQGVRLLLTGFN